MSTPVAPAPAAPAAAGTPAEAPAPKTLLEKQREVKSARAKPADAPSQGSFVKVGGKTMGGPTKPAPVAPDLAARPTSAGAKAGAAAAPVAKETGDVAKPAGDAPAADAKPAPDAGAELKKAFDAKSRELADLRKQLTEYEDLGKSDFDKLVRKLAEHYKADPRVVAEKLLLEHAQKWQEEQELAKLSPEEREYRQLKREKADRDAQATKDAEAAKVAEREAIGRKSYEATTTKLIDAHKLLPESIRNSPEFSGRAALRLKDRLLAMALNADPAMPAEDFLRTIDPAKLAAETMAEHRAELRLALLASDDAALDEMLTPEVADRWTKKLQAKAVQRAHPALKAQPRAGDGKFVKDAEKPAPKPLSQMKPAWGQFLPRTRR